MAFRTGRTFLRFFLAAYRRRGILIFQKSRIQLILLLLAIAVVPLFILKNYVSDGYFEPTVAVPLSLGLILLILLSFILRAGFFLVSGHSFLLLVFAMIWQDMFFAYSSSPVTRMDTLVLLLCALLMAPLLTNLKGLLFHFTLNFLILLLFLFVNPEAKQVSPAQLQTYATDAVIALCLTGIVSYLLVRTTDRARGRVERAHATLEQTARMRTRALREATERLLVSRNEMRTDMEMAQQVQRNMILKPPPEVKGWDIALVARPSAQVSGDFYDFYVKEERLVGVSLFDVSGHGVASGLITILARSIVDRKFQAEQNGTTADILHQANRELIAELKNVNHFLTGVLLRFDETNVEFSSAGHPDLLISRSDYTGPALDLDRPANSQPRGNLLGIAALAEPHPVVRCRVRAGDALLLYSDGIIEAENEDRETFGMRRLADALKESAFGIPGGDRPGARERLGYILSEFHRFLGPLPCDDDLTLVLLIKQ